MPRHNESGTRAIANPRAKKRTKGDRVIVTPAGRPYGRKFTGSRPVGLTQEQFEEDLHGGTRSRRETRDAAAGLRPPTATGHASERKTPLRNTRSQKDDLTAPYGARQRRRK